MPVKDETLYTSEEITLFGREVTDLDIKDAPKKEKFARIYGFTYDGVYYETSAPVLFLVGTDPINASDATVPGPNPLDKKFVDNLQAWTVKRSANTVRLDLDTGKFEKLLLDGIGDGGGTSVSGARVSGARVSGARVSGARVSGARVSGARISGARGDASD